MQCRLWIPHLYTDMNLQLDGKTALVTGSTAGIGLANAARSRGNVDKSRGLSLQIHALAKKPISSLIWCRPMHCTIGRFLNGIAPSSTEAPGSVRLELAPAARYGLEDV